MFDELASKQHLIAASTNMAIQPPLSDDEVTQVFNSVRERYPEISNYSEDDDKQVKRITNGPSISPKKEVVVKSLAGTELQFMWGPDAIEAMPVLQTILSSNSSALNRLRLTGFDYNLRFDIPYRGNHYVLFSEIFYSDSTIGRLDSALDQDYGNILVLDNDIKLMYSGGNSEKILIRIVGRTALNEIASGEYEEKKIRVFCGVQMSKPSLIRESMDTAVLDHIQTAQNVIARRIEPIILSPIVDRIRTKSEA